MAFRTTGELLFYSDQTNLLERAPKSILFVQIVKNFNFL